MKSFSKIFLRAAIVGLLFGIAAYMLHSLFAPTPPRALDFYPTEIRAFLTSRTTEANKLLAASIAADVAIDTAAARLEALPPADTSSQEFSDARRDYLNAGLAKLDHVRRVTDACDNAAPQPAPVAPAPGFFAKIAAYGAFKFARIVGLLAAAIALVLRLVRSPATPAARSETPLPAAKKAPAKLPPSDRPDLATPHAFRLPLTKDVALDMLPINPGSYRVGTGEKSVSVAIPFLFWLGKYEVTQAQWKAVMGTNNNPSKHLGDRLPVERITRAAVVEFCQKITLNEKTAGRLPPGYAYALPTEDEWNYAARAGDTSHPAGWTAENSEGETHNVGELPANAWGFHDMAGNVAEMCADLAVGNTSGGNDLHSLRDKRHITRGGDFTKRVNSTDFRGSLVEDTGASEVGFRLALRKIS